MLQKLQLCTLLGIPGRKKEEVMSNNFNFNNLGADLNIEIDSNNQAQCPECNCKFKYLIKHLNCVKECRIKVDFDKFKVEYQCFMNRRRQSEHRKRKREANGEEMHRSEAIKKRKQRESKMQDNPEEMHRVWAAEKRKQRERKMQTNSEEIHRVEAKKEKPAG